MSGSQNRARVATAFPIGKVVQLRSGLGCDGRSRVGTISAHQGTTVMVKFLNDFAEPQSCDPNDLEEPSAAYIKEPPMNALGDLIEELRLRFLELHRTRFQFEADEEEILNTFNQAVSSFNRMAAANESGVEYGTYNFLSTKAPGEVVDHSGKRVGRASSADDDSSRSGAPTSLEATNKSTEYPLQGGHSIRQLFATAIDKLGHCVDVLSNIVERFDFDALDGGVCRAPSAAASGLANTNRRCSKRKAATATQSDTKREVSLVSAPSKKTRPSNNDSWIGLTVELTNPDDAHFAEEATIMRDCGVWYELALTNAKAGMGERRRIKRKPRNFVVLDLKSP